MSNEKPEIHESLDIKDVFDLEQLEVNLYRGQSRSLGNTSVFGGQVLGQSLMAASHTVEEDRMPHSIHAYFLRPGDTKSPIVYDVDRIRDGRSFTTRRVVAIQHGKPIFNMAASFQAPEKGFEHQASMPEGLPGPEELVPEYEFRKQYAERVPEPYRTSFLMRRPVEIRAVWPTDPFNPEPREPVKALWMKSHTQLPDDRHLHMSVLAYASDFGLMGTSMLPHGVGFMSKNVQGASLDHAMWFHREFRADEWLLYYLESDTAQSARGFNRGKIFTRDGILVASTAQEGLVRVWDKEE